MQRDRNQQTPLKSTGIWAVAWPGCLVSVLAFACFLPALGADFVWDDELNITGNPHFRGLSTEHLAWMWTTFHGGHYQPLSWMTLALDYVIWGEQPLGFHLTNLLLHAFNAFLFYLLAYELLRRVGARSRWAAAIAALFFAVHPLRVESVAWVTERRDLLSGLFYLLSVLAYLRMADEKSRRRFWLGLSLAACGLSLLSKAWAITAPLVFLILDAYPLRRVKGAWKTVLMEKALFAALVLPILLFAGAAQSTMGATAGLALLTPFHRLCIAGFGLFFYVWKTIVPIGLMAFVPIPLALDFSTPGFWGAYAVVSVVGAGIVFTVRRWPGLAAAAGCYVAIVLPVLGFYQSGSQLVADRYSYLSTLGWAVLVGWGVAKSARSQKARSFVIGGSTLVLLLLGASTWMQTRTWRDTETLWGRVLDVDPDNWMAYQSLGAAASVRGETVLAAELFEKALELFPRFATARFNLATELVNQKRWREAVEQYEMGMQLQPGSAKHYLGYGMALRGLRRLAPAIDAFRQSLALRPNYADARTHLASALFDNGEAEQAKNVLTNGLERTPDNEGWLRMLGTLHLRLGEWSEGAEVYRRVMRLASKGWPDAFSLGLGLLESGRENEAATAFAEAMKLDRQWQGAYLKIALQWIRKDKYARAVDVLRRGLARRGDDLDLQNSLAWVLATCPVDGLRDGAEAVRLAEAAQKNVGRAHFRVLDTLAAAYAEAGRFEEAVKTAEKSLAAARSAGAAQAAAIQQRLLLYRDGKVFREPRHGR